MLCIVKRLVNRVLEYDNSAFDPFVFVYESFAVIFLDKEHLQIFQRNLRQK